MNVRSCKDCIHHVLLLTVLYATWQKLAGYQYQMLGSFYIQRNLLKKFTLATRKFKKLRAFPSFRNEIWCMDLAYVDKLAKENNGVKYSLNRQDLFDRTVNAKRMKTKDSQETVKVFPSMITKKNRPKKNLG